MPDPTSAEIFTAPNAALLGRAGRCIGRARRISNSTTSTNNTTRIPVLELDDIPIPAGRLVEVCTGGMRIDGATNNDTLVIEILYTTDGSTPTITSPILLGGVTEVIQPNAASPMGGIIRTTYTPAADETLSLLLTIKHGVGTGAMGLLANSSDNVLELTVVDRGEDPGDTGVDL